MMDDDRPAKSRHRPSLSISVVTVKASLPLAFRAHCECHRSGRDHSEFGAAAQFRFVAFRQHHSGHARACAKYRPDARAFRAAHHAAQYSAARRAAADVADVALL